MKRFLLVLGVLLCLQSCAFARDLRDLGNGFYVDIDSYKRDGNYGYAEIEQHNSAFGSHYVITILIFDFINHKAQVIKVLELDGGGKIVNITEGFELSKDFQGWQDIPESSNVGKVFKYLKNINETIPN